MREVERDRRHSRPAGVIIVESQRETGEKIERETRFYITSTPLQERLSGPMIRDHWSIENSLQWVMDMTFRDDECRIRTEHAPAYFTTLRHMTHPIVRKAPGKDSLRLRRKTAAWDDHYLVSQPLGQYHSQGLRQPKRFAAHDPRLTQSAN